jgi:putative ABC transport system ATP-binding protein
LLLGGMKLVLQTAAFRGDPASTSMINLQQLTKTVRSKAGDIDLLRDVDLVVPEGQFLTITGPSGAGKTTLLNILGLLDGEWSGRYRLDGEPVEELKPKVRKALANRTVGFVFQQYHLLDDLTVAENLELPLSYRNVSRSERQALVADALDRFGIVGKKDLFPPQLSGGQQQLVAVARATIAGPRLILADEPTGSLHSRQGRMVMELLHELNQEGVTIVQVSHDDQNAAYGHRMIELVDGRITADDLTGGSARGSAVA